jgi:hypothetical protein
MDPHAATELFPAAAAAAAAGRMAYLGLARRFPGLLAYIGYIAVEYLVYGVLRQSSLIYFWVFLASTPLETIFNVLAVRQLFTVTFEGYPGIRTVGRWAMYAGLGVSAVASIVITRYFWDKGTATGLAKLILFFNQVAQRSIDLTLAVVIVTIIFVLSKYPMHLTRNTYVSCGFFSALFLSDAARLVIDGLSPALHNDNVERGATILTALLLLGWAASLQRQEAPVARVTFSSSPEEEHLLQQLNSLNELMSRAGRQ